MQNVNNTKRLAGSHLNVVLNRGGEVLLATTLCSCSNLGGANDLDHFDLERDIPLLVSYARSLNLTRIVLIGGCVNGQRDTVRQSKSMVDAQGMKLAWVDWQYFNVREIRPGSVTGAEFVNYYLGLKDNSAYILDIQLWPNALEAEIVLPQLIAQAERFKDISGKAYREQTLLKTYPKLRKVQSVRMFTSSLTAQWFGTDNDRETGTNWVIVFADKRHCKLVSKSGESKLEVVGDMDTDAELLAGSYNGYGRNKPLIVEDNEGARFKVTTLSGIWNVKPHDPLDPTDPDQVWVSMLDRLEQHDIPKHRFKETGGPCEFCRKEPGELSQNTNQCLARAWVLEDNLVIARG